MRVLKYKRGNYMKTVIKVLNLLSFIGIIISSLVLLILGIVFLSNHQLLGNVHHLTPDEAAAIELTFRMLGIIFLVAFPLLLADAALVFVANKKFEKATTKNQIVVWAVLIIIFSNLLSGILMLIYDPENDVKKEVFVSSEVASQGDDAALKLKQLKDLFDAGLISEEEYSKKRKIYLERL